MENLKKTVEQEVIRDEVKKILSGKAGPESRNKKVFDFFNSTLGIFILSTIFISFGSFLYSRFSAAQESKQAKTELLYKLSNEINYRCEILKEMNKSAMWEGDYYSLLCAYYGFQGTRDPNAYYVFKSLYQEFEHRNLASLIIELNFVTAKRHTPLQEVSSSFPSFEKRLSSRKTTDSAGLALYRMTRQDSLDFQTAIVEKITRGQRDLEAYVSF